MSGRITALAVNPTNSSEIWAGAADGGVWHSTNGGSSWTPMTDTQATLSTGAIAIDPHNPGTIYIGTGEANLNGDAYWGVGILKSVNDGASWTQLGFAQFGGLSISRIAVDPNNSSNILVAATYGASPTPPGNTNPTTGIGLWRSADGGSTWTQALADTGAGLSNNPDGATDVAFDPTHANVVYAAMSDYFGYTSSTFTSIAGLYKSTNDGVTWTQLTSGIPTGSAIQRLVFGISHDGQHLYAVMSANSSFGTLLNSAIYVSANAGATWTAKAATPEMNGGVQWWYDINAAVDPSDATGNTAYISGIDVWKTTDGGTSWVNTTNSYNGGAVHPDEHALVFFSPTSSSYYIGNDGGIWAGNSSGVYTDLNSGGLNITQFYGGSIGTTGGYAQLYGGAQDNGELQYPLASVTTSRGWQEVYGGDGGNTVVDYTNNAVVYEEYVYLALSKSTDGGATWNSATNGIDLFDPSNFIAPFVESPNTHNVLFAGTDRVYKTSDGGNNWAPISSPLDGTTPIFSIAVARGNDNFIYVTDDNGEVFSTTNGGATWSGGPVAGSDGFVATGVAIDPYKASVAYVTFAGFATGVGHHVFKTTNFGATWADVSSSLPNIPFESVVVNPANNTQVVVGSDVGVFVSSNGGGSWAQLGSGLPNVAIDQIFFDRAGQRLFAATHGRGMWLLS